jgi:hypothetical protein
MVRFDNTETHKKMRIGDNGVSNPGMIMKRTRRSLDLRSDGNLSFS